MSDRPIEITPSFGKILSQQTGKPRHPRPAPVDESPAPLQCRTMVPGKGRCSWPYGHGPDHDVDDKEG